MITHRFNGDREAPTPLARVRSRRPLLGTGDPLEEIRAMMRRRTFYLEADSKEEPEVRLERVEDRARRTWKTEVPVSERLKGARAGRTLEQHPAAKFLETAELARLVPHRGPPTMAMAISRKERPPGQVTRRAWIAGALATGLLGAGADDTAREIDEIKAGLEKAGIQKPRVLATDHYLALGDANEQFLRNVLVDCEWVASAYLEHFRARGFEVKSPRGRMSIIALANGKAFAAYARNNNLPVPVGLSKSEVVPLIVGLYDRILNRLVVFQGPSPHVDLSRVSHEATHQLTFNTGLLAREGDIPRCIIEGLGCYGECRRLLTRPEPGQRNLDYIGTFVARRRRSKPAWLPLADLLSDDTLLVSGREASEVALAYAESWILIHYLMNQPARLPGFRNYLVAIKGRHDRKERLADAKEHLGDLAELELRLKRYRDQWVGTV
jgi:hypothetical protein